MEGQGIAVGSDVRCIDLQNPILFGYIGRVTLEEDDWCLVNFMEVVEYKESMPIPMAKIHKSKLTLMIEGEEVSYFDFDNAHLMIQQFKPLTMEYSSPQNAFDAACADWDGMEGPYEKLHLAMLLRQSGFEVQYQG